MDSNEDIFAQASTLATSSQHPNTLTKKARENEGSHTQNSSFLKTSSPRLLKKELSPMGEMGIGAQEKNTL